jgi:hypothetical protein
MPNSAESAESAYKQYINGIHARSTLMLIAGSDAGVQLVHVVGVAECTQFGVHPLGCPGHRLVHSEGIRANHGWRVKPFGKSSRLTIHGWDNSSLV